MQIRAKASNYSLSCVQPLSRKQRLMCHYIERQTEEEKERQRGQVGDLLAAIVSLPMPKPHGTGHATHHTGAYECD